MITIEMLADFADVMTAEEIKNFVKEWNKQLTSY